MAAHQAAFVQQYVSELQDLTFNSKAIINTLTMLASENRGAAQGVSEAIGRHIHQCSPQSKLPALYLLDSIVKNVGLPYTALFASDIPEIYMAVWASCPDSRPSLQRLLGTWQKLFPQDVLVRVGRLLTEAQIVPAPAQRQHAGHHQTSHQNRHQQNLPGPPMMQTGYQQQSFTQGAPGSQQPAYGQQSHLYSYTGQPVGYGQPYQDPSLPPPPSPNKSQYAAAYTPTYPQPQVVAGQVPLGVSPRDALQQSQQSSLNSNALPAFLSQLLNTGLISGDPGGPSKAATVDASAERVSFTGNLKEYAARAFQRLFEGTQATKPKFLDQRLAKKRKLSAGIASSRQWYVKESDWLAGTTASAEATPAFFDDPEEAEQEGDAEEETTVPADPDQPVCALSGERFESLWDDARSEWRYQGAAALTSEQALRYGLKEGQLVKLSCLTPTVPSGVNSAADTLQVAAIQEAAEQIAELDEDQHPADDAKDESAIATGGKHSSEAVETVATKRLKAS